MLVSATPYAPERVTAAGDAGAATMANCVLSMRTLPGFRATLITPCGSNLVRIPRRLQA